MTVNLQYDESGVFHRHGTPDKVSVFDIGKRLLENILPTNATIDAQTGTVIVNGGTNGGQNYAKLVRLARLPRLYKLLRIMRLFKMIRLLKYNRNIKRLMEKIKLHPASVRMITLTMTVCFLVHLISCFYFMIVSFNDFEPDSWIV